VATRFDKLVIRYEATVQIAAITVRATLAKTIGARLAPLMD
jgi:hypothetical protein